MATLATVADVKSHLEIPEGVTRHDDALRQALSAAESLLARETGRTFADNATTVGDEVRDGTGTDTIYANRPIQTLNEVRVGRDNANPVITLDGGDVDELVWRTGGRRIRRATGAAFPEGRNNLHLDYEAQAFAPEEAKMAVIELVARTYNRAGSEGVARHDLEHRLVDMRELEEVADDLPLWQMAVESLQKATHAFG